MRREQAAESSASDVTAAPLTVGTAGHIDHGKTELVRALTGVDTDRLPEEKRRGITIVLGYAPLRLPSGRTLSLVDVPGHERLVRVMVSGASGIDLYLLVIAADDGVMPQTVEHVRALDALGVSNGVVAITKCDLADPQRAIEQARELRPDAEVVACCARTGAGIAELAAALERAAARTRPRAQTADGSHEPERALLHIDRVFTIKGAGTVVTGTLWAGRIERGQQLRMLPGAASARVRAVQVHGRDCERALAGQRVAVNLRGVPRSALAPGDVLAGRAAPATPVYRLTAALALHEPLSDGERVQVHHGTRNTPARALRRDGGQWELRTERPLIAAPGERLVLRRISPPTTIGGGVIVRAGRERRSARAAPAQGAPSPSTPGAPSGPRASAATAAGATAPTTPDATAPAASLPAEALALARRLREAGAAPPSESELGEQARWLAQLRAAGLAVRIGRSMYAHPEALAEVRAVVERVIAQEGFITLARLRDELQTSRKFAQALLEYFDAARVTLRLADDRRVLRRRGGAQPPDGRDPHLARQPPPSE